MEIIKFIIDKVADVTKIKSLVGKCVLFSNIGDLTESELDNVDFGKIKYIESLDYHVDSDLDLKFGINATINKQILEHLRKFSTYNSLFGTPSLKEKSEMLYNLGVIDTNFFAESKNEDIVELGGIFKNFEVGHNSYGYNNDFISIKTSYSLKFDLNKNWYIYVLDSDKIKEMVIAKYNSFLCAINSGKKKIHYKNISKIQKIEKDVKFLLYNKGDGNKNIIILRNKYYSENEDLKVISTKVDESCFGRLIDESNDYNFSRSFYEKNKSFFYKISKIEFLKILDEKNNQIFDEVITDLTLRKNYILSLIGK